MDESYQNNKMSARFIALLIGLTLNALGNGLTISSNAGSPVYTAAAVGLSKVSGLSVSIFLFSWGFINALTNQILLKRFDGLRFIKELLYMLLFSYFAGIFARLIGSLGIGNQGPIIRVIVSLIGIVIIGISISLNQRSNILMHPNDDTTNILRFRYMKGSAVWAQITDLTPPVLQIIIVWIFSGHPYGVGIATICFFFFVGFVVKYTDRLIWPSLIHNFSSKERE